MSETTEPRIQHSTLSGLLETLSSNFTGRAEILGLNGSSDAWFSAGLLTSEGPGPVLLVVAPDQMTAQRFYRALFFITASRQRFCSFRTGKPNLTRR